LDRIRSDCLKEIVKEKLLIGQKVPFRLRVLAIFGDAMWKAYVPIERKVGTCVNLKQTFEGIVTFECGGEDAATTAAGTAALPRDVSVQVEVDFDFDGDADRVAIFHGRLEFPVLHCLNGLLVEAHAERADHVNVAGTAVQLHDQG